MQRTARILLRFALSLAGFLALLALGALGVYFYPYVAGLLLLATVLILFVRLAVAPLVPGLRHYFEKDGITLLGCLLSLVSAQAVLLALLVPWFVAADAIYHYFHGNLLQIPVYRLAEAPYGVVLLALFHVAVGVCGIVISLIHLAVDIPWRLRQARQIENLPRSKARSAAIGLAELYGVARGYSQSPPGNAAAGAGQVIIDAWQGAGARNLFYLEDETGRILVDPRRAQIRSGWSSHLGGVTNDIILRPRNTADGGDRYAIMDGDPVYVLGNVQVNPEAPPEALGAAGLVVRPLETPRMAGTFWKLLFGREPADLATSVENIFVVTNGSERMAHWLIRDRIGQAVMIAAFWVCASAWLVWKELPRLDGIRGWNLSEYKHHAAPGVNLPISVEQLSNPSVGARSQALAILWEKRAEFKQPAPWHPTVVPGLLKALGSDQKSVRDFAQFALAQMKPHAAAIVPEAARSAQAGDSVIRLSAIGLLGRLAAEPDTAIPVLVAALRDKDSATANAACHALAAFERAAVTAFECLRATIDGSDPDSRLEAMRVLVHLKVPAGMSLPLLRRLLNGPEKWVRYQAAIGLNLLKAGAEPALPELIEALKIPYHPGDVFVVRSLGEIGPPAAEAVPLLLAKLKESGGRNQEVIQALGRIGPGAAAAIPLLEEIAKSGWNPELRSHAARALREIRKERR